MTQQEKSILTALATILGLALLASMTSCSTTKRYERQSLIAGRNYKTTKRDIKRSMSYSTWEYGTPKIKLMMPASQSNMIIENK